jgi:chorismate synthase
LKEWLGLSSDDIDNDLKRRQTGHGRGGRMKIESDHADIISGVRWGVTIGSPISLHIENMDWKNWTEGMSVDAEHEGSIEPVTRARPGHADLCGAIKYDQRDIRNILERSSARETAMRVALGAVARKLLNEFGIRIGSYVTQIGATRVRSKRKKMTEKQLFEMFEKAESSSVRCPDEKGTAEMVESIDEAKREGNSLGGIFEVFAAGLPVGMGSHVQWYRKLDGRLTQAVMSIQAIKGVEIGLGFEMGGKPGSEVMDEIFYGRKKGFYRKTNNSGGIEGGMTNGMPLIIRAVMKPIPTQKKPLRSVDIATKEPLEAAYERSDVCAVPAAGVIAEAMVALVLADAFLEKFGGDSIGEIKRNYEAYQKYVRGF